MQQILSTTQLKNFTHRLSGGEQVVRNTHLFALIKSQLKGLTDAQQQLLAQPHFSGYGNQEVIKWVSNLFTSTPRTLLELSGEDKERYVEILKQAIEAYQAGLPTLNENTRNLITQALTIHDPETVYCADGNVVITEWGMAPTGKHEPVGLIGIDFSDESADWLYRGPERHEEETHVEALPGQDEEQPLDSGAGAVSTDVSADNNPPIPPVPPVSDDEESTPLLPPDDEPEPNDNPFGLQPDSPQVDDSEPGIDDSGPGIDDSEPGIETPLTPPPPPPVKPGDTKKPWWKGWWKWLLLLLLLLLLCGLLLSRCGGGGPLKSIPTILPPIDTTDIVLEDSIRYVAGDRVVLMIRKGELEDFVRDFQKDYDSKQYKMYNAKPDGIIKRVTLLLPKDKRETIEDELQQKYPQYDVVVIPESIYDHHTQTNDPGLSDDNKNWYFEMCGVFDAWDVTMGSDSIIVAVIDGDIDVTHPELKASVTAPFDAYRNNGKIPNPLPNQGHGTHVAGTAVGAAGNAQGVAGIAPKCTFMPISATGPNGMFSTTAIIDAIEYAILQGASVVNMSLGMRIGEWLQFMPIEVQKDMIANTFKEEERIWNYIFEMADQRNVTFVLAGGNENVLIGIDPMARSPLTIKVSAVQPDKIKANFSNYGEFSTLSAPGVKIYNAWPHSNYKFLQGTSMAAPIVTGGVALLKSKFRGITTAQVIKILQETGIPSPSDVGPIVHFGRALRWDPNNPAVGGDCDEIAQHYEELLRELEKIRREHPECIQDVENPDTLIIPEKPEQKDFTGLWKSTTSLTQAGTDKELVLYFQFNGNGTGTFFVVEPNGDKYTAPLTISISGDIVLIDQTTDAKGPGTSYSPYRTKMKPDRNRRAQCHSINKVNAYNQVDFNLIRIR